MGINNAEEIAVYTLHMLTAFMGLGEVEIHAESVEQACRIAGLEYTKMDETKLTDTNPSKEFERRMKKVLKDKSPQRQNHKAKGWTRHIPTITRYAAIISITL